jgi:hypothetical protein
MVSGKEKTDDLIVPMALSRDSDGICSFYLFILINF